MNPIISSLTEQVRVPKVLTVAKQGKGEQSEENSLKQFLHSPKISTEIYSRSQPRKACKAETSEVLSPYSYSTLFSGRGLFC